MRRRRRGSRLSFLGRNAAFEKAGHTRLIAPTNEPVTEEGCIDLLVQLMLPLCGNEEFDIDVSPLDSCCRCEASPEAETDASPGHLPPPTQVLDELPQELQLLPPEKQREPDAQIRGILIETLVLLATNRTNREAMRNRGVYPIIKEAHLKEQVSAVRLCCFDSSACGVFGSRQSDRLTEVRVGSQVKEAMVRLVNLLMREEGPDTAVEEVDSKTDESELPAVPQFGQNGFVSASGEQVSQQQQQGEAAAAPQAPVLPEETEEEKAFKQGNLPLSRMQPEEDEDEMLLEV